VFEVLKESLNNYNINTGKIKLREKAGNLAVWGALNFGVLKDLKRFNGSRKRINFRRTTFTSFSRAGGVVIVIF
jgi:hypothetical protein